MNPEHFRPVNAYRFGLERFSHVSESADWYPTFSDRSLGIVVKQVHDVKDSLHFLDLAVP